MDIESTGSDRTVWSVVFRLSLIMGLNNAYWHLTGIGASIQWYSRCGVYRTDDSDNAIIYTTVWMVQRGKTHTHEVQVQNLGERVNGLTKRRNRM